MTVGLPRGGHALDVIVLDIEGTTTPIDFVYNVLFPYARAHVAEYLRLEGQSEACRAAIALLAEERAKDVAKDVVQGFSPAEIVAKGFSPAEIVAYIHWLMDRDRKSPGLKALQGLIWQEGYRSGELRGQVYGEVPAALEGWRSSGRRVCIYSSGSVLAQQLLFQTTAAGDLTRFLSGYFDTAVGPKTSSDSYRRIVETLGVAPDRALFVSDVVDELDAARTAGMRTALCVRAPASPPADAGAHPVVRSFDEIQV